MDRDLMSFLQYLKGEKRYSTHTIAAYKTDISQCLQFLKTSFEIEEPSAVRHQFLRSWMVELLEIGIGARSINRKISALRAFFNYLKKQGRVSNNPTSKIIAPKVPKRLPQYLQEKEIDALLDAEAFEPDFSGQRDRMLLLLLYHTGLRRAELIHLDTRDIDRQRMNIRVLGKGGKERLIPFGPNLLREIDAYLALRYQTFHTNSGPLCLTNEGNKMTPKIVYSIVKKHLQRVSTISMKSPHALRHSFATHLSNNGAELNAIKELLGHANLAATQVYTHNTIEKLKEIYRLAHPKGEI